MSDPYPSQNYMPPQMVAAPANFTQPAQYNPQDYSQHPATRPSAPAEPTLEARVAHLESWMETIRGLIAKQRELMEELRGGRAAVSSTPPAEAPKTDEKKGRSSMTYTNYVKVQALVVAGKVDKDISQELGIPYTTVRKYKTWTAEEIEAAKRKEVNGNSDSRAAVQTQWTQDGTVQAPTPPTAGAGNTSAPAQNAVAGQPYQAVTTAGISPESYASEEVTIFSKPQPFPTPPQGLAGTEYPMQQLDPTTGQMVPMVGQSQPPAPAMAAARAYPPGMLPDTQPMQPRMIGHQISYLTNPPTMVPVFEGQPYNTQSFVPYQPPAPTEPLRINPRNDDAF